MNILKISFAVFDYLNIWMLFKLSFENALINSIYKLESHFRFKLPLPFYIATVNSSVIFQKLKKDGVHHHSHKSTLWFWQFTCWNHSFSTKTCIAQCIHCFDLLLNFPVCKFLFDRNQSAMEYIESGTFIKPENPTTNAKM